MYSLLINSAGLYSPGFMGITINSAQSLNDYLVNDDTGVFFHEYVHFLQDIYTTYGIANFSKLLNQIRVFYHHNKTTEMIEIPYLSFEYSTQDINNQLFSKYLQYINYETDRCEIISIQEIRDATISARPVMQYVAELKSGKSIYLGTICILEGMAQLLQDVNYPNSRNIKMIPYDLVPSIAHFIAPNITISSSQLIILCEISLFYFNSMEVYINLLEEIQKTPRLALLANQDFYSYFYQILKVRGEDNQVRSLRDEYHYQVEKLITSINDVFKSEMYDELRNWLLHILQFADSSMHDGTESVFIRLANPENGKIFYFELLTNLGFPPTLNQEGEMYIDNKLHSLASHSLIAIRAVFDVLSNAERKCHLKECCLAGDKWVVTDECSSNPWNRKLDDGELCPFCAVWKTFGLEGKLVVDNR
jgi:hypothetical protein